MHRHKHASKWIVVLSVLLGVACATPEAHHDAAVAEAEHAVVAGEVHWSYDGETGPEHWSELGPDFGLCREGRMQSPVDIVDAVSVEGSSLVRRLESGVLTEEQRATVMDLADNGHTIQVTNDAPMTIDIGEEHYELVQYHFHSPSEHTVNGEHSPLEIHFVHRTAEGKLAVIGLLVEEGEHSSILEPIVDALPSGPDDPRHLENLTLDMSEVRPVPQEYYRYQGSLTTPPCSEGVEWIVIKEKREISADQMEALVSRLHDNNRPVQPVGEREIELVEGGQTTQN